MVKMLLSCRCEVARKFHASSDHGQVGLSSRISIGADAGELRTGASGRGEDDFTETVRTVSRLASEGGMAVPEERDDVMLGDQKVPRQVPLRVGLSPTVERMFGALVDSADEADGDSSAELETKGASRPNCP